MKTRTLTHKPDADRAVIAFRLPAEEKAQAEELARRLDTNISTAARIIFRRGLESPERITL
jgi:hypothetical protein